MQDDLYSRISNRIEQTEQRLKFKFDRINDDFKALGASVDRNDKFLRAHVERQVEFQRKMLARRVDHLQDRIDDIAESQAQMRKTLDLIRAAVILGPDAVRYAMAWGGPPPFVVGPSPASSDASPADSGTTAG